MDASDGHADREWRLLWEEAWPGPMNMTLDEITAETAASPAPQHINRMKRNSTE